MDTTGLFLACRKGDVARVQYLVEEKDVELNVRDKWDTTPLYYACLCGHEELVKYLLENGAKCEANTFDGERCLYGALSNEIRYLLKNYKAVTSATMRRDIYSEFLRRLLERPGYYEDIHFDVHGERMSAHRCILAVRSEYFSESIKTKWKDQSTIAVTHKLVKSTVFKTVLQYLYTGRFEIALDQAEDVIRLARHCRLTKLEQDLEQRITRALSFESTKPGVNVTVIGLEPDVNDATLNSELCILADQALPIEFCNQVGIELPFPPEQLMTYSDVVFIVQGHHFQCHKVFFAGRSEYFKVVIEHNHFGETHVVDGQTIVTLRDVTADVFVQVIYYVYQDSCELTPHNVYDVLCAADVYLLPGLKRQCASVIVRYLEVTNVINIVRTARLFGLARLEDQCAAFLSAHVEQMVKREEFAAFVQEDARTVQCRQQTDTIPIIDEMRFHITNFVQTFSDMYDADQKLAVIDAFLEELQLDG